MLENFELILPIKVVGILFLFYIFTVDTDQIHKRWFTVTQGADLR